MEDKKRDTAMAEDSTRLKMEREKKRIMQDTAKNRVFGQAVLAGLKRNAL